MAETTYEIRPSEHTFSWALRGFEVLENGEYLLTAQTEEHARKYVEAIKVALKPGTRVQASSGFTGEVLGLDLDYHSGNIQYKVKPDGHNVSWWGSSIDGTTPLPEGK